MCDTLVSLTDDGPLFAKNSDRDPNEAQVIEWVAATDHPGGATVQATWTRVPQAPHTHAVLLSRPWWMWGAEMGANEHGVVIGNEAVFTRRRVSGEGLLGMDLLRLALERATTAEGAVATMIELLERHGQGGSCSHEHPGFRYHNSFLVADPSGAMVLETADREWATEEVRGRGRSISNGLTISGFAEAHADPVRGRVAACRARRSRTEASAEVAEGVLDMFAALRDHGHTGSPRWSPVNGALSAPCAHAGGFLTATQTTASWVSDLRSLPEHWATATSAPCTSVFKPVSVDQPLPRPAPATAHATEPASAGSASAGLASAGPMGASEASNRYDPAVGWWQHERLHRTALRDHAASLARFGADRDRIERRWVDERPDTAAAFAEAEHAEERWLADLAAAHLPDRRPSWLRRRWRAWNEAAGVPGQEDR